MIRKIYFSKEEFEKQKQELGVDLPYADDISILSTPITIKNKRVQNRLVCQAMEGCDGTLSGSPDVLTKRRYERFAKGGAGLIWYEATAVLKEGKANPRQLYICKENVDDFKRQVEEIKQTGLKENGFEPIVIMQATHSGRYSKPNGVSEPWIAYNNPIFEKENPIASERIVSDEYLDRVKDALVDGAKLAQQAGFDGVDIKACHRYLNCELLSAYNRNGRYGGCLENRTRLLVESAQGAVESCDKDFIVTSRLNVYDGFPYPYGFGVKANGSTEFDNTEPIWLLNKLQSVGVPLVNISMGNPYFNPHVNRPFAIGGYTPEEHPLQGVERMLNGIASLKKEVSNIAVICSGISYLGAVAPHITSAFIQNGGFDFAGFGRTIFAYPDFANDILKNGGMKKEKCCICCSKCTELMRAGSTTGCVIKDREVYAPLYKEFCQNK